MQPILMDFPDHFETDRLLLRAPRPGDGQYVYEAIVESLDTLRCWPDSLSCAKDPSAEASETFCRNGQANFLARTDLPLLIFLKGSGVRFVGCTGLHRINWDIPKFEIGYWCRKSCEGQGLVTEAVRGIAAFAKQELGARRLEIRQNAANLRSRHVAERAGFTLEGTLRNDRRAIGDVLADTCIFGLTA